MNQYSERQEPNPAPGSIPTQNDEAVTDPATTTVLELPSLDVSPLETGRETESTTGSVDAQTRIRESRWFGALQTGAKILAWAAVFPFLCLLPFVVVLRTAVVAYQENIYDGWESLGIGMTAAVLLVCLYIGAFMWSFGIRRRLFMPLLNICLMAMLCYSGYALFHLATSNAKTEQVRSYYTSLHPFLRVAVKNLTLVDPDLVITDTHRTRDQYRSMGLQPREYSLHFRQSTGFVHAMDLRTNGRPKAINLLVELYFILMGFETIRHVGTADHLHVALPLAEADEAAVSSGN